MEQDTFEAICKSIAAGMSGRQACIAHDVPQGSLYAATIETPERQSQYARARDQGLDCMAESILDIADDGSLTPEDRRIRIDPRKWFLSKVAPRKYGDKLDMSVSGDLNISRTDYGSKPKDAA